MKTHRYRARTLLTAVGIGMMASFLFIVSGARLLLVGVESQARHPTR